MEVRLNPEECYQLSKTLSGAFAEHVLLLQKLLVHIPCTKAGSSFLVGSLPFRKGGETVGMLAPLLQVLLWDGSGGVQQVDL